MVQDGNLPSSSLPTRSIHFPKKTAPPVSWPFLRDYFADDEFDDEDGDESRSQLSNEEESKKEIHDEEIKDGSVLGPLGALITELTARPKSDVKMRRPIPFPVPRAHNSEFTCQDMRRTWAHWVQKREGQDDGKERGEVRGGSIRLGEVNAHEKWESARLYGWL